MGLKQYLAGMRKEILELYLNVHRYRMLEFEVMGEEEYRFALSNEELAGPSLTSLVNSIGRESPLATADLFVTSRMLGEGVKAFAPTAPQCEALEQTDLTLPCEEYAQPFETFVVDLPKDYASGKTFRSPYEDSGVPHFVALTHLREQWSLITVCPTTAGLAYTWVFRLHPGVPLSSLYDKDLNKYTLHIAPAEVALSRDLFSLAVNSVLLADSYGITRKEDPDLEKRRKKAGEKIKKGIKAETNLLELARIPDYYSFSREVVLCRREETRKDRGEGTGKVTSPHWRRGHWRMQPHGPGMILRKKVRIAPVLVNSGDFLGESSDTSTYYRGKG